MSIRDFLGAVEALPTSTAIRESANLYPALLTTHVLSMCGFAGLVAMMDLRLIGVGHGYAPLSQIQKRLFPWQMGAVFVTLATGAILVYAEPLRFYDNVFFWAKLALMALAGANALVFHWMTYSTVSVWDTDAIPPAAARMAGVLSLVLWAGVIISGRLIAYNWFD